MSSVFTSIPEDKNNINVNVFDWSHENNLTTKLGMITPILCEKLPPKSSISIDCRHAFQLMPMVFPIQTTIKARVSFYKMPIRALWKNYQDWVSSVNQSYHKNFVPPFVGVPSGISDDHFTALFGTSSLADYFGLPTTFDGYKNTSVLEGISNVYSFADFAFPEPVEGANIPLRREFNYSHVTESEYPVVMCDATVTSTFQGKHISDSSVDIAIDSDPLGSVQFGSQGRLRGFIVKYEPYSTSNVITLGEYVPIAVTQVQNHTNVLRVEFTGRDDAPDVTFRQGETVKIVFYDVLFVFNNDDGVFSSPEQITSVFAKSSTAEYNISTCPWWSDETNEGLKISALPWRMYDSVYNTFVRYIRNNPLYDLKTGLPLYNKVNQLYDHQDGVNDFYLFNDWDGKNSFQTFDQLLEYATPRYANWEFDQFTTCVQSPQDGVAPLVGLTTYATTTQLENGETRTTLNQYVTDENGDQYQVNMITDEEGIQSVNYTQVQQINGTPVTSLYQAISEGISIADLRNVNAYTRYLELNQRRGYRYKDIVEGRFDVKVRFDELLMPEFIGGYTRDVRISPVTQTVQMVESGTTYDGALGSKAGDAFVYGESGNRITTYCDEASIILGVISFTPKPVYTQTCPRWLYDRDILDDWSPEFNALGFQPLSNKEVAPIQYYNNDRNNLDAAFGYQRPWYHLCGKYDVAHGDFRGNLRNFLMHRVFDGAPKLTKDFLLVSPDQVNDVFNVQEDTDKIFGQIAFDIKVKLGVNRSCVPRLE